MLRNYTQSKSRNFEKCYNLLSILPPSQSGQGKYVMLDPFKIVDLNRNLDTSESFSSWLFANHEELRNLGLLLAAICGLLLLLWRSFSLNRSSKAAEQQAKNAALQAKNTEKQVANAVVQAEIASESHVADTYSRAIEQLGAVEDKNPSYELRLGGLYALEKIALANKEYHPQIMEVLCAYVRLYCQNIRQDNKPVDSKAEENDSKTHIEPLRIDIQAFLTVIGRRNKTFDKGALDLSRIEINQANLFQANLRDANLFKANLSGRTSSRRASSRRTSARRTSSRRTSAGRISERQKISIANKSIPPKLTRKQYSPIT